MATTLWISPALAAVLTTLAECVAKDISERNHIEKRFQTVCESTAFTRIGRAATPVQNAGSDGSDTTTTDTDQTRH